MRRDGPDGEEDPRASQGVGPHVVQDVGDAEQRQEEEQRLERLPAIREKFHDQVTMNSVTLIHASS